jgi:hypothetical protein
VVNLFGTEGVSFFSEACLNNFVDLMQYRLLLDLAHSGTRMLIIFRQVYSYIWHTYNNRDGCWRSRFNLCSTKTFLAYSPCWGEKAFGRSWRLSIFRQKKSSPSTEEYIQEMEDKYLSFFFYILNFYFLTWYI